jgi:hypothetical protein
VAIAFFELIGADSIFNVPVEGKIKIELKNGMNLIEENVLTESGMTVGLNIEYIKNDLIDFVNQTSINLIESYITQ